MLIAQRPILSEEVVSEYRSRFIIEPLEPGFGYTLGNSLRRTLLSSIPGAAVTSARVEGALHEFTTLEGVKEDLTEIVLNIKGLVLSSDSDEPVVMYIRKSGEGVLTGADIVVPAGVEVHNPEIHIATLNAKAKVEIELTVERGRGYVTAVQNKQAGQEIGRIPIDSIYSPVLKVTYKVEATRAEYAVTMPPIEITATSVVPPPISTIKLALGRCTGSPAPIAAAIGSSMMYTGRRAPANSAASCTARRSTPVISEGTQIIIRGLFHLLVCTCWMK